MSKENNFELLTWQDAKDQVKAVLPEMYDAIARLAQEIKHPFIKLSYQYGDPIVQQGKLKIKHQGNITIHDHQDLPTEYLQLLQYPNGYIPLSLVAKGFIEFFVDLPSHLIPYRLLNPGKIFGLYNFFYTDKKNHIINQAYGASAGSRSLLVLPKISHEQYNERLSKHYTFDNQYLCPKHFSEQWMLFKELAQAPEFKTPWQAELLVFTRPLFELINKDKELQLVLLKQAVQDDQLQQNQIMYDLLWSIFLDKLSPGVKNTPFVVETVKHIVKLALGKVPGFLPAQNNDQGPIEELRNIFLNIYRIRYYLPVFMELGYFNKTEPIYYSLQKHTFWCHIPERSNANRTVDELMEIRSLIHSFKEHVLENKFPICLEGTNLQQALQEVDFEFYHPQGNGTEIQTDVEAMVNEDPRFMRLFENLDLDKDLVFPKHSLFFNGCIRVRSQKKIVNKPTIRDMVSATKFRLDDKE